MRDPIDIFKNLLKKYEEIKAENRKLKQKIEKLELKNKPLKSPMDNGLYVFVDITGHCFEDFENSGNKNDPAQASFHCVGAMLRNGCEFGIDNMLAFGDELVRTGFVEGTDFYVKRLKNKKK